MSYSYDDDEPGSPWTLVLHVDGPGELGDILLGSSGGEHMRTLPWCGTQTGRCKCGALASSSSRAASVSEMQFACVRPRASRRSRASPASSPDTTAGHRELINDEVMVNDPPLPTSCMAPVGVHARLRLLGLTGRVRGEPADRGAEARLKRARTEPLNPFAGRWATPCSRSSSSERKASFFGTTMRQAWDTGWPGESLSMASRRTTSHW